MTLPVMIGNLSYNPDSSLVGRRKAVGTWLDTLPKFWQGQCARLVREPSREKTEAADYG